MELSDICSDFRHQLDEIALNANDEARSAQLAELSADLESRHRVASEEFYRDLNRFRDTLHESLRTMPFVTVQVNDGNIKVFYKDALVAALTAQSVGASIVVTATYALMGFSFAALLNPRRWSNGWRPHVSSPDVVVPNLETEMAANAKAEAWPIFQLFLQNSVHVIRCKANQKERR